MLKKYILCEKCNQYMNLNKSKNKKVGYIWRGINPHDIEINIRYKSIFKSMKTDLRLLCFIIFYNYIVNKSINQIYINYREFSNQLHIETISKKNISKFCNILCTKIMKTMHND